MLLSLALLHTTGGAQLDPRFALIAAAFGAVIFAAIWTPAPAGLSEVRARARLPHPTLVWPIVGAWALALFAQVSNRAEDLHHGQLIEGGIGPWLGLLLFLVAWQVMIAAMMLPSSLPLIRLFNRTAADQPRANSVRAMFLLGYVVIWTGFGALAFGGDIVLHRVVDSWAWLRDHDWLIGGSVLIGAGLFQFSSLKDRCLNECRHPGAFLMKHYRRGASEAFRIGRTHGLFCLGCCWALMLVAFAVGVANLAWMAVLTLVMLFEKTGKRGDRGVAPIGGALIALGVLVLAHPGWLPPIFATA